MGKAGRQPKGLGLPLLGVLLCLFREGSSAGMVTHNYIGERARREFVDDQYEG
jgi:hypothetical protein